MSFDSQRRRQRSAVQRINASSKVLSAKIDRQISKINRRQKGLQVISDNLEDFAITTVTRLLHEILVPLILQRMGDAGYSQKIIDSTYLDRVWIEESGSVKFRIVSDYITDGGFDISIAREETGTTDHDIFASGFLQGDSSLPQALPIPTSNGTILRKKAHVSGIEPTHIVFDTIKETKREVQREYRRLEREWKKAQTK